jgi:hypothetical protein
VATAKNSKRQTKGTTARPARSKPDAQRPEGGGSEPRGKRLKPGDQAQRDILILQRRAQGWTWDAIAVAAGLSERRARDAAAKRRAEAPLALKSDPVQIVEDVMLGLQLSVGRFEELAARYQESAPAAAVGAAKAADDARLSVLALLQAVGRLPEDLTALRHITEQRALGGRMVDAIERFSERTRALAANLDAEARAVLEEAVRDVECVFSEMIGLPQEVAPLEDRALPASFDDLPVVDGDLGDGA